jgi:hypothetical protein
MGELVRLRDQTFEQQALDAKGLLAELAEAADWKRYRENKDDTDADPPDKVITAILGARALPFPPIDLVARAPFFSSTGQLVVQPGYHGVREYTSGWRAPSLVN